MAYKMVIVADASPIIALSEIGRLEILKELYHEIIITDKVAVEIGNAAQDWMEIVDNYDNEKYLRHLQQLDPGEARLLLMPKAKQISN